MKLDLSTRRRLAGFELALILVATNSGAFMLTSPEVVWNFRSVMKTGHRSSS